MEKFNNLDTTSADMKLFQLDFLDQSNLTGRRSNGYSQGRKRYNKNCPQPGGASLVGFAAVNDINRYAPEGHRPTDFLDRAKSVMVVSAGNPSAGTWKSYHPGLERWVANAAT